MLLFAVVAHEVAHGWAALRQGDDTAYKLGRLTLNPIPHIDPVMTILVPAMLWFATSGAFTFGAAKPVPIIPRNFRNYRRGDLIVSSAGVATNLVLALLATALFIIVGLVHQTLGAPATQTFEVVQRMLSYGVLLNVILAVFNLIPIPPLDGSRIFYHLLPPALGSRYRSLDRFGMVILIALLWFGRGVFGWLMTPAWIAISALFGVAAPYAVGPAAMIFQ